MNNALTLHPGETVAAFAARARTQPGQLTKQFFEAQHQQIAASAAEAKANGRSLPPIEAFLARLRTAEHLALFMRKSADPGTDEPPAEPGEINVDAVLAAADRRRRDLAAFLAASEKLTEQQLGDFLWKCRRTSAAEVEAFLAATEKLTPEPAIPSCRSVIATHIDTRAPLTVAKLYRAERSGGVDALAELAYWQGDFYRSLGTHYEPVSTDALRADIYGFLDGKHDAEHQQRIKPTKRLYEAVHEALKAAAYVDVRDMPTWLDGTTQPPASELIACRNGLLYIPLRKLYPPTRAYFGLNALDFAYDPAAPEPREWLRFLNELWDDDQDSIECLQELFGLLLTGETRFQKAFLIIGPRRSGKGTIARVLTALVGLPNVVAPMLTSLGQQFGLESMIGKTVALVSDARLGGRADIAAIAENLLRITGEDAVSVPRKFKTDWTARLRVRFVILSNELPALLDQSGALAGRFILLRLKRSFFGVEDLGLADRLLRELPGVLLWSLNGLDRLQARGHLKQPASAIELMRQLGKLCASGRTDANEVDHARFWC